MPTNTQIPLGRFRLDVTNECLWEGVRAIALRPKAYAVLKHLVDRPGQLVTKHELLEAVWPGTFVGDAVLKSTIGQLREALGDDAESPRYIQTAHRRGYRFVGAIDGAAAAAPQAQEPRESAAVSHLPGPGGSPAQPTRSVLGREAELSKLRAWLELALAGQRQIVFVTGEAGIGKTTLVHALLDHASASRGLGMARGQCLEQYGACEAYLPVLDALSRLGRGPDGERVVTILRRFAPAWLMELRSLTSPEERERATGQHPGGASRERMLREIADAIEAMTSESPLVLVLEDLHWSDYSTLDLIAYLARRSDPARLMLIGTYRPVDVILGEHPLKSVKRELQAHGLCHELPLEYLTEEAVVQYLAVKLGGRRREKRVARLIHQRSEGNPLFMVNLVDYLIDEGNLVNAGGEWRLEGAVAAIESGVPDNVRELIEKQIERLSPDERTVLEGASVVGMQCSSVAIGAGLERSTEWVEEHCEALVQRHRFLSPARLVELPDGTMTPRYKFSHVLYLDVPYRLLPAMRRSQIHRRIGASGEAIYQHRVGEIAAELAMHFEQGHDHPRAVKYLLQAAENARYRSAHHEAEALARRGLRVVATLPQGAERDEQELGLRLVLAVAVMAIRGFAAAEVRVILHPGLELGTAYEASSRAFKVRWLLGYFHYFRAEMQPLREIVTQLADRASDGRESLTVIESHRASGVTLVELGRCQEALPHLDTVIALYDPERLRGRVPFAGWHPNVVSHCFAARALWMLGYPDQALARIERGVSVARHLAHDESLIVAMHFAAHLHQLRGEAALSQDRAETVIEMSEEYGLAMWIACGHINRGWARVEQGDLAEGVDELRQGLAAYEATGAKLWKGYFVGLLARALAKAGLLEEARAELAQALGLIAQTGEYWSAAELYRLEGDLLMTGDVGKTRAAPQAEACFRRALTCAREQQAKSWELRVLTSLGRFKGAFREPAEAHRVLKAAYDSFSEGRETADLREAQSVLSNVRAHV